MTDGPLLQVSGLRTYFDTPSGVARALDGVDVSLARGEVLGVVGESGSGKSVLSRSILRLVQTPPGRYAAGKILFDGRDILECSEAEMLTIRGNQISMIFQEPMTSLNPVLTIGFQIAEVLNQHRGMSWRRAKREAVDLLNLVGIADPERRLIEYPHQLSGGMRQRVMIAIALGCQPKLLIADEPTTALDVTIQAQILELLRELRAKTSTSIIFITHNLGVVSEIADRIIVMYGGRVMEEAPASELFDRPSHPYTVGLLQSTPPLGEKLDRLYTIPGSIPAPTVEISGCRFRTRCPHAKAICAEREPPEVPVASGHWSRCWLSVPAEEAR